MTKITDITTHPKFQPKLDPEDPNYERDQYLRDWDAGELYHTAREEIMETMLPEGSPIPTEDPILSEPSLFTAEDIDELRAKGSAEYPLLTVEDVETSLPEDLQEPMMIETEIGFAVCRD